MAISFKTSAPATPPVPAPNPTGEFKAKLKHVATEEPTGHEMGFLDPPEPVVDLLEAPPSTAVTQVVHSKKEKDGTTTVINQKEEINNFVFPPHPLEKLCTVSVGGKRKLNLANYGGPMYESAEIFVSFTAPCTMDTAEQVFTQVKEWVDSKISKEVKEATKGVA